MKKSKLIAKRGHRCEKCGNSIWNDQPIPLEKHHINPPSEKEKDLQLLCPNCHAQTGNFCNRKFNPTDEDIRTALTAAPNMSKLLFSLGINPTGENYETMRQKLATLKLQEPPKTTVDRSIHRCLKCECIIPHTNKFCSLRCCNQFNAFKNAHPPKIDWPKPDYVLKLVNEHGFLRTAKMLSVSDNAVRKFLKRSF